MNYMKQVAEMLGVELGEEFTACITETQISARCRFADKFLKLWNISTESWHINVPWLQLILNGSAEIKEAVE